MRRICNDRFSSRTAQRGNSGADAARRTRELEKLFRAQLSAAGLDAGELTIWSTPRRLALIAKGLPDATAAVSEELKGPRSSAPPQALEGFLRKTGLTQDQLEDRDGVYFAVIDKPGRATADVLAEAIPAIIRAFAWPKSMRWGKESASSESLRWVRPLSGIVAIFGEELIACEVSGIAAGFATRGHRFHCPARSRSARPPTMPRSCARATSSSIMRSASRSSATAPPRLPPTPD
jgi:glycyl-tRNA synthetase beta subunit